MWGEARSRYLFQVLWNVAIGMFATGLLMALVLVVQTVIIVVQATAEPEVPEVRAPVAPAWAEAACGRLCGDHAMPHLLTPSDRSEDGGWRCFCDPTAPPLD